MAEQKAEPTCYDCHRPIVFDWSRKGKNNRPIPLDPETKEPHKCPEEIKTSEDNFKTDDPAKANKSFDEVAKEIKEEKKNGAVKAEYVDHTLARPSEVKIFFSSTPKDVEEEYKTFQIGKKFAWTRAQFQPVRDEENQILFCIAFYYELAP